MRLKSPTEHAIYGAAYVRKLYDLMTPTPEGFTPDKWAQLAADAATAAAERVIELHREAMRRRRT